MAISGRVIEALPRFIATAPKSCHFWATVALYVHRTQQIRLGQPPHPAIPDRKPVRHHARQSLMNAPLRLPVADGWLMFRHIPCSRNAALGAVPERLHDQPRHGHAGHTIVSVWLGDMRQINPARHKQRLHMVKPAQLTPDDLGALVQQRIGDGLVLQGRRIRDGDSLYLVRLIHKAANTPAGGFSPRHSPPHLPSARMALDEAPCSGRFTKPHAGTRPANSSARVTLAPR